MLARRDRIGRQNPAVEGEGCVIVEIGLDDPIELLMDRAGSDVLVKTFSEVR